MSGQTVDYNASGILRVALTQADATELQSRLQWMGDDVQWLNRHEIIALEPRLGDECTGGIYFSGDHQIHAPKLADALRLALFKLGVQMIEHATILEWLQDDETVITGVHVATQMEEQTIIAEQIVIAAGAWSTDILAQLDVHLAIRPVKGQIMAVTPHEPIICRTVFTKGCYVVPKQDGSYVVGATEEDSGFDKRIIPTAVERIRQTAFRLLPALEKAQFVRTWTGLRPGSADGMPFLGKAANWRNLFVAAGHYRNGILLTPVTAMMMREMLAEAQDGLTHTFDFSPFAVNRTI
jgi:glycine oxidase